MSGWLPGFVWVAGCDVQDVWPFGGAPVIHVLELRWGRMDYSVLRFFEDGICPHVRFGEFFDFATGRELFPLTALTFAM